MKLRYQFTRHSGLLAALWCLAITTACAQETPGHWKYTPTPPLGWNSWDCFGTTLNEKQAKQQADAMARDLLPFGWNLFTVDIQWYEPDAQGHDYKAGAPLEMDSYGRLVPAVKKFPSSADGVGFKALADYIHSKGLKFGIHAMRGIARQAVRQNTPVLGTNTHAADIADQSDICSWNPDMYGVDMSRPGAQEYYDSLITLYASWGVDFIKVDDLSSPYHTREIEAIRKAIDKSGRAIVLSTSPGPTPLEQGQHVMRHANMWRISNDFWDRWPPLYEMLGRLDKWTPYRGAGHFPDADMLPFGIIEFNRPTHFTKSEQFLCMSLWCIARSPLILGSDMTKLDEFTRGLLNNPEVLAVNQASTNNRQLSNYENLIVWAADAPDGSKFVGLFDAQDDTIPYNLTKALYRSPVLRKDGEVADISVSIKGAKKLGLVVTDGGDGFYFDHADWIEPTLVGPKGELKLSGQQWTSAKAGWGEVRENLTVEGKPMTFGGKVVGGIGTHAVSFVEFDLPEGYDTFKARGILSESRTERKGSVEFMVLTDAAKLNIAPVGHVSVAFAELGIRGKAKVRDLWRRQDLGMFADEFSQDIPLHGGRLFRITPQP